jgi:hypothetical protein
MLEWAGINFGEDEAYYLSKAIKNLAEMSGADNLRFWGKLYGRLADYWVIEGELN